MKRIKSLALSQVNHALHNFSRLPFARRNESPSPVFIVGAPRTGSTALYQLLTHCFSIGFIDNLAALFYGSLGLGVTVSNVMYGNKPHESFSSQAGNTRQDGLHGPSECGSFWYRWLPREDHFVHADYLTQSQKRHVRCEVSRAQGASGCGAFLFKNLNAGQRLQLIADVFPEARLIWCRRNLDCTIQSIESARKQIGVPKNDIWSIRPRNWRDLVKLPEHELIKQQVLTLESQIEADISLFPPDSTAVVYYEDWCENVVRTIGEMQEFLNVAVRDELASNEFVSLQDRFRNEGKT